MTTVSLSGMQSVSPEAQGLFNSLVNSERQVQQGSFIYIIDENQVGGLEDNLGAIAELRAVGLEIGYSAGERGSGERGRVIQLWTNRKKLTSVA